MRKRDARNRGHLPTSTSASEAASSYVAYRRGIPHREPKRSAPSADREPTARTSAPSSCLRIWT